MSSQNQNGTILPPGSGSSSPGRTQDFRPSAEAVALGASIGGDWSGSQHLTGRRTDKLTVGVRRNPIHDRVLHPARRHHHEFAAPERTPIRLEMLRQAGLLHDPVDFPRNRSLAIACCPCLFCLDAAVLIRTLRLNAPANRSTERARGNSRRRLSGRQREAVQM